MTKQRVPYADRPEVRRRQQEVKSLAKLEDAISCLVDDVLLLEHVEPSKVTRLLADMSDADLHKRHAELLHEHGTRERWERSQRILPWSGRPASKHTRSTRRHVRGS